MIKFFLSFDNFYGSYGNAFKLYIMLTRDLADEGGFVRSIAVPCVPSVTTFRVYGDAHTHFVVFSEFAPKACWGAANSLK